MKIEIEVHPVGSERYFCDMDMDILRVRISAINVHIDARFPDEVKVQHQMDFIAVEHSVHGFETFGARKVHWQNEPFDTIFETIEEAKARRTKLASLRR